VLEAVPIGRVWSSLDNGQTVAAAWPYSRPCIAGERWRWDGVEFEMLHPGTAHYAREKLRGNDRSCVLRVSAGGASVLLTADIEQKTERELLQVMPEKLPSRILLVPHHGSRTSSSVEFLAQVNPQIALIAAGYRNRFGHPKEEVLDRYRALGSRIYRTDLDGALIVTLTAEGRVEVQRQRVLYRRYWHAALENPDIADDDAM
jgi:competence protein ComEC